MRLGLVVASVVALLVGREQVEATTPVPGKSFSFDDVDESGLSEERRGGFGGGGGHAAAGGGGGHAAAVGGGGHSTAISGGHAAVYGGGGGGGTSYGYGSGTLEASVGDTDSGSSSGSASGDKPSAWERLKAWWKRTFVDTDGRRLRLTNGGQN